MKKAKILVGIIFILLFQMKTYSENNITLCLTGKIELTLPIYKDSLLNSVNLSLSKSKLGKNIIVKNYFYDSAPLSPLRAYKEMIDAHCSAIIGFEYLNDLILISKAQKDTHIPIFTSYSSSSDSDNFPKNIFIFMPSYDYQAKKMMDFLYKKFGEITKVLLITEVNRIDLVKYKNAYEYQLNKTKINYDTFDFLENDSNIEEKIRKFILGKNYNYVFVFSGAVGSTKVVNYMNDHKIKFIGTENFGSSNNQSLYVRLKDKEVNVFTIRNMDFLKTNKYQKIFIDKYFKKFGILPTQLSLYTHDSINIILKTLEIKKSLSPDNILKINFNGITGVNIKDGIFSRSKDYVILSIKKEGFILEE